MKVKEIGLSMFALVCLLAAIPAFGHHGSAEYETEQVVTVEGVVKQFEWTNPHTWLYVTVANDKGEIAEWAGEAGAPGMLARRGWTSHSFKPGDKVKMSGRPAKNGSKQMLISKVQTDGGVLQ
ncbi:MAG TPA: DUF6152 family protein [Verrucomicrobiae bacterium]|nr:DUF6152 family protein [Verrucomicrobiae bacterium]